MAHIGAGSAVERRWHVEGDTQVVWGARWQELHGMGCVVAWGQGHPDLGSFPRQGPEGSGYGEALAETGHRSRCGACMINVCVLGSDSARRGTQASGHGWMCPGLLQALVMWILGHDDTKHLQNERESVRLVQDRHGIRTGSTPAKLIRFAKPNVTSRLCLVVMCALWLVCTSWNCRPEQKIRFFRGG